MVLSRSVESFLWKISISLILWLHRLLSQPPRHINWNKRVTVGRATPDPCRQNMWPGGALVCFGNFKAFGMNGPLRKPPQKRKSSHSHTWCCKNRFERTCPDHTPKRAPRWRGSFEGSRMNVPPKNLLKTQKKSIFFFNNKWSCC